MNEDFSTPMPLRFTTSGRPDGPLPEHHDREWDYLATAHAPRYPVRSEGLFVREETVFWIILFAGCLAGIYLSFRTF